MSEQPPPSYGEATASSSSNQSSQPPPTTKARNGIDPLHRRSMEDEARPLPEGWIRQFDPQSSHQFFVDTKATPPRSIWQHPYDDLHYLESLDPKERTRIKGLLRVPTQKDIEAESSEDDGGHDHKGPPNASSNPEQIGGVTKFGRRLKDKITHTTHEQREVERRKRAEEEQRAYARHQAIRQAMARAMETGEPQLIGKDKDGKDLYIEPPQGGPMPQGAYGYNPYSRGPFAQSPYGYGTGGGGYGGYGGAGGGGYGQQGPYQHTQGNRVYVRPAYPYSRPYGGGYGGGLGLPILGGLAGGLLLGDVLSDTKGAVRRRRRSKPNLLLVVILIP